MAREGDDAQISSITWSVYKADGQNREGRNAFGQRMSERQSI